MNSRKKLEIKEWKSVLVVSVEKVCFVGFVKRVSEKIEIKVVVDNEGCKALYVSKRCEKELEQDRHVLIN